MPAVMTKVHEIGIYAFFLLIDRVLRINEVIPTKSNISLILNVEICGGFP